MQLSKKRRLILQARNVLPPKRLASVRAYPSLSPNMSRNVHVMTLPFDMVALIMFESMVVVSRRLHHPHHLHYLNATTERKKGKLRRKIPMKTRDLTLEVVTTLVEMEMMLVEMAKKNFLTTTATKKIPMTQEEIMERPQEHQKMMTHPQTRTNQRIIILTRIAGEIPLVKNLTRRRQRTNVKVILRYTLELCSPNKFTRSIPSIARMFGQRAVSSDRTTTER